MKSEGVAVLLPRNKNCDLFAGINLFLIIFRTVLNECNVISLIYVRASEVEKLPSRCVEVYLLPSLFSSNSSDRLILAARRTLIEICYCWTGKPSGPVI